MARGLYTLFYYLLTPLLIVRLFMRGRKAPAYRQRIAERFGFFKAPEFESCLWLHAVSVGETIAAAPIVKALQERYPNKAIVVTTMTPTGSERVKALFGEGVFHVYAPYDLPGSISRFLKRVKPELLIIMETELWPNTVAQCRHNNIPVVLANGRMSEKSARGYQRFNTLMRPMFAAVTTVAAQSEADAQRFKQLGVAESDCKVTGSIKFDIAIADTVREQAAALKAQWSLGGERIVWIAASTHEGEEVAILEALTQLKHKTKAKILLVLVPRHPERFNTVAALCDEQGLSMVRRSSGLIPSDTVDVLVGDSMGEMLLLLGAADIAFVGGSLIERGGHNMLEPAAWGLPILTGSSDFNFMEISRLLIEAGALHKVAGVDDLAESMTLLIDENKRKAQGDAALRVVEANRGSLGRLLEILVGFIR